MAFQKLKSFGRRKSTGNALDEPVEDLPELASQESSFKVIPRTGRQHVISFDKPTALDNRYSNASSAQTRPAPGTAASSVRYSSTSTNPSSVELDERSSPLNPSHMQRNSQRSPEIHPKHPGSAAHAPRIDSLNTGKPLPSNPSRDRALTTSSYASTAVPPKLEQPLPALGDNTFDDLESMFAGLGEHNGKSIEDTLLPQPPQRTFQRADSEPIITPRKPVALPSLPFDDTPSALRGNGVSTIESAEPSPDWNRKSTDRLMFQNSSEPSSPGLPPSVPAHASGTSGNALHSTRASRQTLGSASSDEGKKGLFVSLETSGAHGQSSELLKPSSRGSDSSQTFNTSALAFLGDDSSSGVRKMTQRDYEAMKQRERYEDRMKLKRGESIDDDDDDGPTIYEDLDDDEDDRRREKRKREKQQADLAVNRQQMRKLIGRESSDPALTPRTASMPTVNVGAEQEGPHLLPYAHNLPPQESKRLTVNSNNSMPNIGRLDHSTAHSRSSGDEDDDVPLGILQPHIMQKNADLNHRVSSTGSLINGSASITPSHLAGASPNRLSTWQSQPDNRPKSRASNATHLPAFAQRLPPPEQLPLIPGFQGTPGAVPGMNGAGGYFSQHPMAGGASMYGGMTPPAPGPIVFQDGFTGAYHASAPQGATFMDTIQHEEKRKKSKYKAGPQQQYQRSNTMPNMQGFNPQHASMPPMPMMDPMMQQQMAMMQQMQMLQQQMAMMSGMNPNMMGMGMGMDPGQMQQMQMQMQQMSMNGQANGQRRTSMGQPQGNGLRPMTNFLGSLPAIPDASPTRASVLPVANGGLPLGYAPSIAPSERSNVGMPSRYKPVTVGNDNASIMGDRTQSMVMGAAASTIGANSIRATLRPVGGPQAAAASDDDADNEGSGWGAMRARRSRNKQSIVV